MLLLLVELGGAPSLPVHVLGGGLLLARATHAVGLLTRTRFQMVGATLNYTVMIALAIYTLVLHFR